MASPQERRPELTREIRAGACRCRPGRVVAEPWRSSPAVRHLVTQRHRGGFGLSDSDAEPARAVWRESVLVSSALACRHIFVRGSMASFGTTRRSVEPHWRERRHFRQEASAMSKCCHAVTVASRKEAEAHRSRGIGQSGQQDCRDNSSGSGVANVGQLSAGCCLVLF